MRKQLWLVLLVGLALLVGSAQAIMTNFSFVDATSSDDQGAAYVAWKAVDDIPTTFFQGNEDGTWWQGDFGSGNARYVDGYNITLGSGVTAYGPQTWFLYGSNDGTTMTLLDSQSTGSLTWSDGVNKSYQITQSGNKTLYRYMRMFIRSSDAGSNPAITQIYFYNQGGAVSATTFTANVTQFVSPQTVKFTNSTVSFKGAALNWSFGDGTDWTGGNNPTHVYGGNSTYYTVTVWTKNPGFNDTFTTQGNYIRALPKIATFTTSIPISTVHQFDTVTFTSTSNFTAQATSSNVWNIYNSSGAYSMTGDSVTYAFSFPDTYDISLNTTNAWGHNTTALGAYIVVPNIPVSDIKPTTNMQYFNSYQTNTVYFNDTGSDLGVDFWTWNFGDGNYRNISLATFKNTTYKYNSTGTFTPSLMKANPYGMTWNSTPTDWININLGTPVVYPTATFTNRNMTGFFSVAAQNVSRADDLSMYIAYNFTSINVTSMNLNSSLTTLYPMADLNAGYSSPGTIRFNITGIDMSTATVTPVIDVHYLVKDITNYSASLGYPWQPINVAAPGSGTIYAIGNKSLYGSTHGAIVPSTYQSGYIAFTDATFTKLIKFYNNVNNQKIEGQTVTVQWIPTSTAGSAGFGTTTTGEYTISSKYDPDMSVTAQATGYYNGTTMYVWDNSATESQFLTPLSGASGSTVWYTPKQVRFRVMDGDNNPLPSTTVVAAYVGTTLPSSDPTWLQTAYGISRSVADDMVSSGVAMTGTTGRDGYLTFTMHGSLQYNISVYNTTSGVNGWNIMVYPMDNEYLLRVLQNSQSATVDGSSVLAMNGTTLWANAITSNTVRLGLNFTDPTGQSTNVKFMVWDAVNGTVYNTNTSAAPGVAMWQPYYDLPNIRGNRYLWNYSAVRP